MDVAARTTFIRYTTVPVSRVPYPAGLGKHEYPDLESGMRALLGRDYGDPSVAERKFWTPEYQELIRLHLAPEFDPLGDIIDIAAQAASAAQASNVFDVPMPDAGSVGPDQRYWAGLPELLGGHVVREWARRPPQIYDRGTAWLIGDGRHRLSYLRARIEPIDPGFPVLVQIHKTV